MATTDDIRPGIEAALAVIRNERRNWGPRNSTRPDVNGICDGLQRAEQIVARMIGQESAIDATTPDDVLDDATNAPETDGGPEITVLVGDHVNAIYGLHGVTQALCALDEPNSLELAIAARELTKRLYGGCGCLLGDVEQKIEQATGMTVRS